MPVGSIDKTERALIKLVADAVSDNKRAPITLASGVQLIPNVTGFKKYTGGQASAGRAHTDLIIQRKNSKDIKLALRSGNMNEIAPDARTIDIMVPGLVAKFMREAQKLVQSRGYKEGDTLPPIYGRINDKNKAKLIVGTSATGGPIDYVYIGGASGSYDPKGNLLTLSGDMVEPVSYSKSVPLYIALLPSRDDQTYAPDALAAGMPRIYGRSSTGGEVDNRIFLTENVPSSALIVDL